VRARVRQTQIVKLTSLIMMQLALSCNILSRSLSPLQLALARCICALDPPFGWFLIQHTHTPVSLPVIDIDSLVMSRSRSRSRSLSAEVAAWKPPRTFGFHNRHFSQRAQQGQGPSACFLLPQKREQVAV
jgi:hypothetical protein